MKNKLNYWINENVINFHRIEMSTIYFTAIKINIWYILFVIHSLKVLTTNILNIHLKTIANIKLPNNEFNLQKNWRSTVKYEYALLMICFEEFLERKRKKQQEIEKEFACSLIEIC